ncbi:hypothetical protein Fmac_018729 [Flemingia macrophylla]|uniref:Uncharacterized protein n=1 Tax=Flemingia macrophylla TaxID=520843 RepID=A0ABD1M5T2_9FABA
MDAKPSSTAKSIVLEAVTLASIDPELKHMSMSSNVDSLWSSSLLNKCVFDDNNISYCDRALKENVDPQTILYWKLKHDSLYEKLKKLESKNK